MYHHGGRDRAVISMEESWDYLESLVRKTLNQHGKEVLTEAFYTKTQTIGVTIRNSHVHARNKKEDAGVGFRVAIDRKVGFASTNDVTGPSLSRACRTALSMARTSSPVPEFSFPPHGEIPAVEGLYDPSIPESPIEDVVDRAQRAIDAAESFDQRVKAKDGRVEYQWGFRGVLNSEGVNVQEKGSTSILMLDGVGELPDGTVTGLCSDYQFSRRADSDPESVGETVARKVVRMINPKKIEGFCGTVVFGPEAGSYQLTDALIDAVKGENVQSGRSAWTGKIGQRVASEMVTLTDDAILPCGFSSRAFDDEGAPSQRTVLIDKGVLRSYLHTASTSSALGVANTANASRFFGGFDITQSIIGKGYSTVPHVYPSNLVLAPGATSRHDLISGIGRGVLVESMDGFVQAGSGLISARISQGFYIEDGAIMYPIKGGMVSGLAFEWFESLSGIGADVKAYPNVMLPSLRIENVKIVGA
jgi:PmbA protein